MGEKLRIAWFSPLNLDVPGESVSAYVSDLLLPLLRERFEIELFHNSFENYRNFPTFHYLKACERHAQRPFDVFFYQLEDAPSSNFVRIHSGLKPGVVWMHDLLFTTDGPEPILNSPWEETVKIFKNDDHAWPERGREFFKEGPFAFREAGCSAVTLFSNPVSCYDFQSQVELTVNGSKRGYHLPFPVPPKVRYRQPETRERSVIGYAGTPRIEHRAHKLLLALSELEEPYHLKWLVAERERDQAQELLTEFGIQNATLIEGRSPLQWCELLPELDVAVHTLFSVFGQPGPYLAASLSAGLPCLVSQFGAAEQLPDNVVFKIQPGDTEAFEIGSVLRVLLSGDAFHSREIVQEFAYDLFDAEHVADELALVFQDNQSYLAGVMRRWEEIEGRARRSLVEEAVRLLPDAERVAALDSSWRLLIEPVFKEFGWCLEQEANNVQE